MNAKLEAEILNVREDLFSQIAEMKSSKDENEKLILEFHKEKVKIQIFGLWKAISHATEKNLKKQDLQIIARLFLHNITKFEKILSSQWGAI